jgi:heat shock protein HtpX
VKHDDFGRDRGLQVRMLLTLFMLGLIYVVLIAVALSAGASVAAVLLIAAVFFSVQLVEKRVAALGRLESQLQAA